MIVHFSAHISKWELVCKFGVIFHIFIISCLCSRFHVRNQWFFYSVITFSYTKCFVHTYTVDVVFTLSYLIIQTSASSYRGRVHGCPVIFQINLGGSPRGIKKNNMWPWTLTSKTMILELWSQCLYSRISGIRGLIRIEQMGCGSIGFIPSIVWYASHILEGFVKISHGTHP